MTGKQDEHHHPNLPLKEPETLKSLIPILMDTIIQRAQQHGLTDKQKLKILNKRH